jgi:hypothetical protein
MVVFSFGRASGAGGKTRMGNLQQCIVLMKCSANARVGVNPRPGGLASAVAKLAQTLVGQPQDRSPSGICYQTTVDSVAAPISF